MSETIRISAELRAKAAKQDSKLNNKELRELETVYGNITELVHGKKRILSTGCSGCINTALKITHNYSKNNANRQPTGEPKETKVRYVGIDQKPDEDRTLKELREKYPNIKSTSKKGFLEQIK